MVQVIATDHGISHAPDKWGKATASEVCPLDETLEGDRREMAERMRAEMARVLTKYHCTVQEIEQALLDADIANIHRAFGLADLVDAAVEELATITLPTPWRYLWQRPDTRELIAEIIDSHFRTNQQLHRLQYASAHPTDPDASRYHTFFHRINQ